MAWKLAGVKTQFSDYTQGDLWGSNVVATFKMAYSPSIGKFKETPKLDWHETIMMNEHHKGETWVFDTNMYTHNPSSNTLLVWSARYVTAYDYAVQGGATVKGYSKLLAKNGTPVKAKDLEKAGDGKAKADAVRKYLSSKGGFLEIQIQDIPSINKPDAGEHKERVLLFNIGVVGGTHVKAYQYLDLDGDKPTSAWVRKAGDGWGVSGFKTTGMKKVSAPGNVSSARGPRFTAGECW